MPTKGYLSDDMIRQYVLSDAKLYHEAREYGGGGDQEMYESIHGFIRANRARLVDYINNQP